MHKAVGKDFQDVSCARAVLVLLAFGFARGVVVRISQGSRGPLILVHTGGTAHVDLARYLFGGAAAKRYIYCHLSLYPIDGQIFQVLAGATCIGTYKQPDESISLTSHILLHGAVLGLRCTAPRSTAIHDFSSLVSCLVPIFFLFLIFFHFFSHLFPSPGPSCTVIGLSSRHSTPRFGLPCPANNMPLPAAHLR